MPPVNDAKEADMYIVWFKKRQPCAVGRSWCKTNRKMTKVFGEGADIRETAEDASN
jgi:hypothetical protein